MKLKHILIKSFREVFYNSKFAILLWISNFLFAAILSMPVFFILQENLKHSSIASSLASEFNMVWYYQLRNIYSANFESIPMLIYAVIFVYSLIQNFFMGGLVTIFNNPKKNHFVDFFYGGVKFWYRFTKVFFLSVILLVFLFVGDNLVSRQMDYWFNNSERHQMDFFLNLLRYILLICIIGLIIILSDYTKVSLAVKDNSSVFREIKVVINLIRKNFGIMINSFFMISVISGAGVLVYNIIGRYIPVSPVYFLILSFFLQQMLVIFRLFNKMLFTASEIMIYKEITAEVISAEVIDEKGE